MAGIIELDTARAQDAAPQRQPGVETERQLQVA
jgi:hypothetical protein